MVVVGQSSCIWAKVVLFIQNWLYSGKSGSNRAKVVLLFGQSGSIRAKVVVFGQSGCFRAKWF